MDLEPPDELTLARRVAAGDPSAVERFHARYSELLFAFIHHQMGGPRPDVEEVWQDTLLAAVGSLASFRGGSRLFTWLCGIARRKIADRLRRRGDPACVLSQVSAEHLDRMVDAGPLPEEVLARRDTRARVVEALGALPDDYRAALVARYADGQSVDDVARLIGRSYKAAESLLARARTAFREAFRAVLSEDEDGEEGEQCNG
jgi:RNA polymerase sigma-70 factor (ECF subfamily)